MNKQIAFIFVAVILVLASSAWAQTVLYEWVDENNVTHFSTQPPIDNLTLKPREIESAPIPSGTLSEAKQGLNGLTPNAQDENEGKG